MRPSFKFHLKALLDILLKLTITIISTIVIMVTTVFAICMVGFFGLFCLMVYKMILFAIDHNIVEDIERLLQEITAKFVRFSQLVVELIP
jgi:hypothetical protein